MTFCDKKYGTAIKIHIPKEYPNFRIIQIANRSILMIMAPRWDIVHKMPGFIENKPGIYLLYGDEYGEDGNKIKHIYIGEADGLKARFKTHNRDPKKDAFWLNTIIFTTTDDSLTKTGIQYIEAKLIKSSKETIQSFYKYDNDCEEFKDETIEEVVKYENKKDENLPTTAVFENEIYDEYYDLLLELLNFMCLSFFEPISKTVNKKNNTIFKFKVGDENQIDAEMVVQDNKYVVLTNSKIRIRWNSDSRKNSGNTSVEKIRNELRNNGTLVLDNEKSEYAKLTKDIPLNSPSAAGSFVNCRTSNGWTDWVLKDDPKITLSDYIGRSATQIKSRKNKDK